MQYNKHRKLPSKKYVKHLVNLPNNQLHDNA